MKNFEFHNPTRIVFGAETVGRLDQLIPAQARVLILYGGASAEKPAHWPKYGRRWASAACTNSAASNPTPATKR
jgi:NADP-dependent alcohol dehydrogenase